MNLRERWWHWWHTCIRCGYEPVDEHGCMCPQAQWRRIQTEQGIG